PFFRRLKLLHARFVGQCVHAVVQRVRSMTSDPDPVDLVSARRFIQRFPQFLILDGLFRGCKPAIPLPIMDPLCDPVSQILRVGVKFDVAGFFERFQRFDGGGQFHAVIGRVAFAAAQFFPLIAIQQDSSPAAGAGVGRSRSIGVDCHLGFFCIHPANYGRCAVWRQAFSRAGVDIRRATPLRIKAFRRRARYNSAGLSPDIRHIMSETRSMTFFRLVPPVLALLVAWALFIRNIGLESMWYDEHISWSLASSDTFADFLGRWPYGTGHPPFYFATLWAWLKWTGSVDMGIMRLTAALPSLVAVAFVYRLGREWFSGRWVGLAAMTLMGTNGVIIYFARVLRTYVLLFLLVLICFWLPRRLSERDHRRALFGSALTVGRIV